MSDTPNVVAIIGFGVAVIAAFSVWLTRVNGRLERLEKRDKLSWLYIRTLIIHASTHAPGIPLPEPPDGWME